MEDHEYIGKYFEKFKTQPNNVDISQVNPKHGY
jgi:hypothetical protein